MSPFQVCDFVQRTSELMTIYLTFMSNILQEYDMEKYILLFCYDQNWSSSLVVPITRTQENCTVANVAIYR